MGTRVWTVSEVSAGTLNQALGVAEKLSDAPVVKIIRRQKMLCRIFFPFRQNPKEPEPDIIISCGRVSEFFVREIKQTFGGRPFCVHLQEPAPENDCFDLVFVARHHWRAEFDADPRFREMLGVPNRINAEVLASRRAAARTTWAPNGEKVAALLVGGPSKAFVVDDGVVETLSATVQALLSQGWRVLATVSRRSPPSVAARLGEIDHAAFDLWSFQGENPYLDYLAAADAFVVTEDSITMVSEAAASGKPIHVLPLRDKNPADAATIRRFHTDLFDKGVARPFRGKIEDFSYTMDDETERVFELVKAEFHLARGNSE